MMNFKQVSKVMLVEWTRMKVQRAIILKAKETMEMEIRILLIENRLNYLIRVIESHTKRAFLEATPKWTLEPSEIRSPSSRKGMLMAEVKKAPTPRGESENGTNPDTGIKAQCLSMTGHTPNTAVLDKNSKELGLLVAMFVITASIARVTRKTSFLKKIEMATAWQINQ